MSKFFKIAGAIYFFISIGLFLYFIFSSENILFSIINLSGIINGLALIAIGDLMERMNTLEEIVFQSNDKPNNENKNKIQQIECPNCHQTYDIDYPKCPHCGFKNENV